MRYDTVNEKSTSIVTLSFADEAGNAVTPTSGTYRIDDVASGTQIKGDTAFAGPARTRSPSATRKTRFWMLTTPASCAA